MSFLSGLFSVGCWEILHRTIPTRVHNVPWYKQEVGMGWAWSHIPSPHMTRRYEGTQNSMSFFKELLSIKQGMENDCIASRFPLLAN